MDFQGFVVLGENLDRSLLFLRFTNKRGKLAQQHQSRRFMATLRFGATGVYKRKEIPPPFCFFGGAFETTSDYSPNPAIPAYYIRTLHFVEYCLCMQQ